MEQQQLKKCPIGIQTFEKIIEGNYLYVDKTEYVYRMVHGASNYCFLSRPRRFGKSLLTSTLHSYFAGKKDLFRGLAIEKLETEWTEYPVLHFDMSLAKHVDKDTLESMLSFQLSGYEQIYGKPEEAVKLIFANLEKAYTDGKDLEARGNMLKGSYLAGRAFTHAYVGYVHAIAHNLGGLYGTPHGLANAVILPYVLDYYGDCIYPQLAKLADIAGVSAPGMSTADKGKAFIAAIRQMNENMNIPSTFDMIKEEDIPLLVQRALKEGNPLYPVPKIMDAKDCEAVIRSFMA